MNKNVKLIILIFCILKLALFVIADSHVGFQRDELLHIETGKHLAFGYMEFPPLIGFLAFLQNLFHSETIFVHHIFAYTATVLIIVFLSKIVIELGGKENSVLLTLMGFFIAPGFYESERLFQPVVFSQLFWVLCFYQLIRFINTLNNKNLWYLTIFCTLAFLTKYDAIFFFCGLSVLLLWKRTRRVLIQQKFWINVLVFILLVTPNLFWQYQNQFPALQMFNRLNETQLGELSKFDILKGIFLSVNPLTFLILLIPAIFYFFKSRKTILVQIGVSILVSFLFLLLKNGKPYYFFPLLLCLIPFGGIFWEKFILQSKKWIIYPLTFVLLIGSILIPFGIPVYTLNRYLVKIYPFERKDIKGGKYAIKFDEYYSKEKWNTTMEDLKSVYDSLPNAERQNSIIWAKNYTQAGAVNLLGRKYNIPTAVSYHGSFYTWAPDNGKLPETTIALSYQVGDFFKEYFDEVTLVKTIYNPYAENEEELYQRIYICKKPIQNYHDLKKKFANRIFE